MEYCTLTELKKKLSIDLADTSQDIDLTDLIKTLTSLIDLEIWWNLWNKTITRRISWMWTSRLILEGVVNSVESVKHFINASSGESQDIVVLFVDGSIVHLDRMIPKWNKNAEIVYKRWFDSVPIDMKTFFLKYCSEMYIIQRNWEDNIKTKKIEWLSITYLSPSEIIEGKKSDTLSDFWSILKKYKNFNSIHY